MRKSKLDDDSSKAFWAMVDKQQPGGCWLYEGRLNVKGYGVIRVTLDGIRQQILVHRLAYRVHIGAFIPRSKEVSHSCDVRRCVNPRHLVLRTHAENVADGVARGRIGRRKLTLDQYPIVKDRLEAGEKIGDLAVEYGVSRATIAKPRAGLGRRSMTGHVWMMVCRRCGIEKPKVDLRTGGVAHVCVGGKE